ncbi:MAG: AAA family ATPase, partial [Gammaproteobacteria bacterium]|nr:AAA family ATPase [Gammaproteobacteria bacterium]
MSTQPTYELKQPLWTSASAIAYSGTRRSDARPVIIKCAPRDTCGPDKALAQLQREYRFTSRLLDPYHLPTLGQDNIDGYPVFIYEDTPHRPLAQTLREHGQSNIADTLHLAIELTKALNTLHARHIVHGNICAHSVLWEPITRQVRLTDFGLAQTRTDSLLRNGASNPTDPAYTSPEMTGRIDQPVDLRSDLYSLGVLLYEQFTGTLPFPDTDILSVVHGHLAIVPSSPATLNPELPSVVSNILMKLLEKMADNRYQNGHSLLADLERCRTEYRETGNIRPFPIGAMNPHGPFHISDTIYGRAQEIDALLRAWNQACDHCGQTVFILGAAGTGKTRLAQELRHAVDAQGGLFLTGKFEQSEAEIPYQGFVRIIKSLTRHLLSLDDTSLQQWCTRLRRAVKPNGGILTSLAPQLEQLLGPQTDLITLGTPESHNRFNRVLLQFFAAIADAEHPTVLHLDDLHWADPASLELLRQLAKNSAEHHLLLLSGYRHKAVDAQHPITAMREA